ncbi:MAG: hypothetical protein RIC95_11290 [Vicingaceae bacterium]
MDKKEIKENTVEIYHKGDSYKVSQTMALIKSEKIKIQDFNIKSSPLTATQLKQFVDYSQLDLNDFFDRNAKEYDSKVKGKNLDQDDQLKLLIEEPELLKTPLAKMEDEVILIDTPTDVLRLKNIDKVIDSYNHSK